jgi:transcriptional regulator with XRE-family HTH domain
MGSLEDLGTLLRQLRKATGKSMRTVAELVGIAPGTLYNWEAGKSWPLVSTLDRLLRFYGKTVSIGWPPDERGEK